MRFVLDTENTETGEHMYLDLATLVPVTFDENTEACNLMWSVFSVKLLYRHFRGKWYEKLGDTAVDGEWYVVYRALYGDCKTYMRPREMFFSDVDKVKYPDVIQQKRFENLQLLEDGVTLLKQEVAEKLISRLIL